MTTFIKMPERRCVARGFTLVEVMVAAGLAGFVLLGVLTTNVQLMRSGVQITQYAEMESQARRSLEQFGRHARIANGIRWNSATDITLTIPTPGGAAATAQVTYAWSAGTNAFFSVPGPDSTATTGRIDLVHGIPPLADGSPGVTFARFDRDGGAATTDLSTKRIEVTLAPVRQASTMAASQNLVSATFTMRNKVTQ